VRTPLPWDAGPHGGFSSGEPWLPLGPDHQSVNVAAQTRDPHSMLSLYRSLLALRRGEEALVSGAWGPLEAGSQVLAYERRSGMRALVIALNLSDAPSTIAIAGRGKVLLSTHLDRAGNDGSGDILRLRPNEGCIIERLA
jgi:alpha-glucosidase